MKNLSPIETALAALLMMSVVTIYSLFGEQDYQEYRKAASQTTSDESRSPTFTYSNPRESEL